VRRSGVSDRDVRVHGPSGTRLELGDLDEAAVGVIGVADVVEMGRFLSTFDGDFRRHFATGRGPDTIDGSPPA
jgi:hypothetical protein